ncbi:MAG: CinA family protein [Thermodesulfobacteriota bacterium]
MGLEKTIGNLLRQKGWTLSIAESCTGGLVCDRITDVSGSSDYFMGGMVTYSNESKAEHLGIPMNYIKRYGAVSPQVAKRMAQGVRKTFHTTFGLSTTGVAGPTGGTKRSPLGRVFIALTDGRRTWVKKLDLKGSRREIKKETAQEVLQFLQERLMRSRPS